jgi:hypothetical protein
MTLIRGIASRLGIIWWLAGHRMLSVLPCSTPPRPPVAESSYQSMLIAVAWFAGQPRGPTTERSADAGQSDDHARAWFAGQTTLVA